MISLRKIFDEYLDEEDKKILLVSFKDLNLNDENDFIEIIKLFFHYNLEFGEKAVRYILKNEESINLKNFPQRFLLEFLLEITTVRLRRSKR
jgi:hypothetical protein